MLFSGDHDSESFVRPSEQALFAPDTPIRIVHADLTAMMVGGVAALLLQTLHPHALQGVLDHSDFRRDMRGRLRRTARFIAVTTYGHRDEAEAAIERVNAIHERVNGTAPDGSFYSALDPKTLAWVHVAEAWCFLEAHCRYVRPNMPAADKDIYFAQGALIARKLHADPVPESRIEAERLMKSYLPQLATTPAARETARIILAGTSRNPAAFALHRLLAEAAVDLLPPFARRMLRLDRPWPAALPTRFATAAIAGTLRWAFRKEQATARQ